jgi:hypothetical protein
MADVSQQRQERCYQRGQDLLEAFRILCNFCYLLRNPVAMLFSFCLSVRFFDQAESSPHYTKQMKRVLVITDPEAVCLNH